VIYKNLSLTTAAFAMTLGMYSSVASATPILIVNGANTTSETGTTSAITQNLKTLHEAAGGVVTILNDLPAAIGSYKQVWDLRFSNVALSAADQTNYAGYLQAGGGLFLMGENSGFMNRNNSILSFINTMGGGSLGFTGCAFSNQKVHAPFTDPNSVTQVTYNAPGCMNSSGTGAWITSDNAGSQGTGVAFGVGSLANAQRGALTSIFDVNFMMNTYDLPNSQQLTKNLIRYIDDQVTPVVSAPATAMLMVFGIAGLVARRRKSA
jgi:hypothetical protein